MPTVQANGVSLHYERTGGGPTTLFLNGSGSTIERARPILSVLTRSLDVIAHDQRGLGRTSVPPGPYSMADYAADAIALLDALGVERCQVVGISFGGMVAQELAVTVPDRVERLALLCTSPGGPGGSSYPLHEVRDLPPDERAAVSVRILDSRFTPDWLASHPGDRALVQAMGDRSPAEPGSEQDRGERLQLDARRSHDVWERLPRITCPTLVMSGRFDGIAPLENGEAIAARIPHAELRVYDGGHAFFAQDPSAFPDLLEFLTRRAPTSQLVL